MKNSFGNAITLTLFGESHGEGVGVVIDGLAPGLSVSDESIRRALSTRRPYGEFSTSRIEEDDYRILSGVKNGKSTGAPLALWIPNTKARSGDYEQSHIPRPSHADYTANVKYHGFEDRAGGGHFSGRLTAPIVAASAIFEDALRDVLGIELGVHILSVGGVEDEKMTGEREQLSRIADPSFPVFSAKVGNKMKQEMKAAVADGDSVGGIVEGAVFGMPAGVGEPWFDSVESVLSHLLFSIGGVKGVEFGDGFAITRQKGSEANDPFAIENGRIVTTKNASGGIQGGITNGMPILVRVGIKPTPSIYKAQQSVDLSDATSTSLTICGRHDGAIVHRATAVVRAMLAFGVADLLTVRYGTDVLLRGIEK